MQEKHTKKKERWNIPKTPTLKFSFQKEETWLRQQMQSRVPFLLLLRQDWRGGLAAHSIHNASLVILSTSVIRTSTIFFLLQTWTYYKYSSRQRSRISRRGIFWIASEKRHRLLSNDLQNHAKIWVKKNQVFFYSAFCLTILCHAVCFTFFFLSKRPFNYDTAIDSVV